MSGAGVLAEELAERKQELVEDNLRIAHDLRRAADAIGEALTEDRVVLDSAAQKVSQNAEAVQAEARALGNTLHEVVAGTGHRKAMFCTVFLTVAFIAVLCRVT